MITEDYVSFEVAKLLKEKGFDEPCHAYYEDNSTFRESYSAYAIRNITNPCFFGNTAPTLQMTMKWLRKVHSVFITILHRFSNNADNDINFSYVIDECNKNRQYTDGEFTSYEEAVEAAIIKVLKKLP